MSSRVLKKLQGDKDLVLPEPDEDIDNDVDETNDKGVHFNPFDLLNQPSESESEVKEDDNETEHTSAAAKLAPGPAAAKKKKKKRKKKSKHAGGGNHISSEDNELIEKSNGTVHAIPGVNGGGVGETAGALLKKDSAASTSAARADVEKSLFTIELRHLNPQNEMRRTFGRRVVKADNKRGRPKHSLKTIYLVTVKDTWPSIAKNNITMRPISSPEQTAETSDRDKVSKCRVTPNQVQWFTYEHSHYYQGLQHLFLPAIERTDSDFLINLIRRCPYHVESLIQLSELCKMTEDYALAADLIERAVYVLETALHPSFSLTTGKCRLDYRRQENRSLFIVLFKHAQYLEARACCRTAFELSKLILSLDPKDPLAMVLIFDYYAIRSRQYAWLITFYEEYDRVRNLSQLPNMAYSYALALYCVQGESEKADEALQYALLIFPGVLRPLLEELSVVPDKRILASSFFSTGASASQPPSLHQLVCLYICRAKVIWRQSNILRWLERNVAFALNRVDNKDHIVQEFNQKLKDRYVAPPRPILRHVILSDYKEKVPLAPFVAKEKEAILAYDPLPPHDSISCYERKSSSSRVATSSPTAPAPSVSMFFQSMLPTFNFNARPADAGEAAAVQQEDLLAAAAGGAVGGRAGGGGDRHGLAIDGRDNIPAGVVAAAAAAAAAGIDGDDDDDTAEVDRQLRAFNLNLEQAAAQGAADGSEASASYRELTQSITHIVDAMRDFLHNFHISDRFQAGDGDGEDDDGEEGSTEEDIADYYD